mgnify:CR=1 FL=1
MAQIEKHIIYAQIILEKIQELFDEDNESLFDKNELINRISCFQQIKVVA